MGERESIAPVSIVIQSTTFRELIRGEELTRDAIIQDEAPGSKEDYLVIHYLLKVSKATYKSVLEITADAGLGTKVIKNAVGDIKVYSLSGEKENKTVESCDFEYTSLYGDSMNFDYSCISPPSAWFINGTHDYAHVLHESTQAIKYGAKLVIWNSSDTEEVFRAIKDAFKWEKNYRLTRVEDTRIMYAVKMHGSSKGL